MLKVLLQRMAIAKASDAFITAGAPICLKVNGELVQLGKQVMEPHIIREMAYAELSEQQIRSFEERPELNFSIILPEQGNFRINMFRQRGTIALAVRFITFGIPTLDELGLPPTLNELIMAKRGLILVVGSTGVGKSTTLASMIDHRITNYSGHVLTLEDPIRKPLESLAFSKSWLGGSGDDKSDPIMLDKQVHSLKNLREKPNWHKLCFVENYYGPDDIMELSAPAWLGGK